MEHGILSKMQDNASHKSINNKCDYICIFNAKYKLIETSYQYMLEIDKLINYRITSMSKSYMLWAITFNS